MKKTLTKVLASLLAVLMLIGALPFASVAAEDNVMPEKPWGYNRYYFYQPEEWINEYTDTVGIYWWEGTDACTAWPGYVAHETDVEGIYYYDVNQDVTTIIWNNAIDGGVDYEADIYTKAYQTKNIGSEYYDVGESVNYPNGTENFDEMIYVIDPEKTEENEFSGKKTYAGEWYYYYGNGEYGFETPEENSNKLIDMKFVGEEIVLYEGVDGEVKVGTDEETGEEYEYSTYSDYERDVKLELYFEDGTTRSLEYKDVAYDYNFKVSDNQQTEPWNAGVNHFYIEYRGVKVEIPVTVVENPVKSIEFADDGDIEVVENIDGYIDDYYDYETGEYVDYFRYSYSLSDVIIRINYKDGTSEELPYYDLEDYDYDDNQYDSPWGLGEHSCTFEYMGFEIQIPVTVVENPVKSIELADDGNIEIVENADGYMSERYDDETDSYVDYFRYSYSLSDVIIRINYKDGTSEEVSLYDVDDYDCNDNQYENPWSLGEHSCTLEYMGYELQVPVTVVKSPVVSLELIYDGDIEFIELADGYYDTYYDPETDTEIEYFIYSYYNRIGDVEIKINYDDETSVTLTLDELRYEDSCYTEADQISKPWVLGSDNFFTLYYMGKSLDVPVTVVPNTVAGFEVVSDGDVEVVENIDGYYSERYDDDLEEYVEYFKYDYSIYDATFKITYTDGTSKVVDYLYDLSINDDQYDNPWNLGEHSCTVSYMGFEVELPVTVIKNPVESIKVADDADIEVVELVDGYYDTYYDEETDEEIKYFEYDYNYSDVELEIKYTDGTSENVLAFEIWDEDTFRAYSDQAHKPWTIGGENLFTIEYMGHSVEVPVSVVPNTVAGLEVVSDGDIEVIENVDGYMDERYDEELDEYVDYFRYRINPEEAVVKVVYTDGTSEEISVLELDGYSVTSSQDEIPWELGEHSCTLTYMGFEVQIPVTVVESPVKSIEIVDDGHIELVENLDGYYTTYKEGNYIRKYFEYDYYYPGDVVFKVNYTDGTSETFNAYEVLDYDYYDDQAENHWVIGGEHNYFTFEYMDCTAKVPVYIIENPVDRIEMTPAGITLYEGVDGYWNEYSEETGESEYFYYRLDWDKISMTVYYKDGTKKTDVLNNFNLSYLDDYSDQNDCWNIGEKHEFTIEYYGYETVLEVTIAESPVEKIELVKGTDQAYVEYANGWFAYAYLEESGKRESFFYYDLLVHDDAQIKIYYKDGTTEVASVGDEVLSHDIFCYSNQNKNHWAPDKDNVAVISFMDVTTELPVKFGESDVESISLVGAPIRIEENTNGRWRVTSDSDGETEYYFYYIDEILKDREFEIKYKDGTKETVTLNDVAVDWETQDFEKWLPGKKNIVLIAYGGGLLSLSVDILSADALANGTYGDVTCDGKVNIKDATHIQKYAAKLAELTDAEFTFADVNTDGKVNVKDATAIQKYLAKIDTGLPIEKPVA